MNAADNIAGARFSLARLTEKQRYHYLFGTEVVYWTTDNMPKFYATRQKALKQMIEIEIPVWIMDKKGEKISSKRNITINARLAGTVKDIFKEIYELEEQFPIDTLTGFRWNKGGEVSGAFLESVTVMSAHAYGAAIDINYYQNDYYLGKGNDLRNPEDPYYITQNVIDIFEKYGWYWGRNYGICADTMHFQYTGLEMLSYNNGDPFTEYSIKNSKIKSERVFNVQRRLSALGYLSSAADGYYGTDTRLAVLNFQREKALRVTGTTTEEFYIALYNLTHLINDKKI